MQFIIENKIPSESFIMIDSIRLRQVLFNLIANAVKFTNSGHIKLRVGFESVSHKSCTIKIDIEDTGIGIAADQQEIIFQAFHQQSSATNRRFEGTGMGLVISKKILELMGGSITLKSSLGEGSEFSIHLPADLTELPLHQTALPEEELPAVVFAPFNMLIIDGIGYNISIIENYLSHTPCVVFSAEDYKSAVNLLDRIEFDIIILSSTLRGVDTDDILDYIKASEKSKQKPIIGYLAGDIDAVFHQAKINFDGFLHKPLTGNELFKELMRHLPYETTDVEESEAVELNIANYKMCDELNQIIADNILPDLLSLCELFNIEIAEKVLNMILETGKKHKCEFLLYSAKQLKVPVDEYDWKKFIKETNKFKENYQRITHNLSK